MASVEDCEEALERLSERLAGVDDRTRRRHALDRTISCTVTDLATVWQARLCDEGLAGLHRLVAGAGRPDAQVRLTVGSDDLVALTEGNLGFGSALATGRVKIDASVRDLLKLRALL